MPDKLTVTIASPLEEELVDRIRECDPRLEVLHEPDLLPPMRFASDHSGDPGFRRDDEGERRWRELLEQAEVLFGFPGESAEELRALLPRASRLRWVQAMAAGAGQNVRQAGFTADELERVAVTTSSGVHAGPLAEFCLLGLLAFAKDLPKVLRNKEQKVWPKREGPVRELRGQTLLIVGLGDIGLETARLAAAFGMRVIGVKRNPDVDLPHVDEVHSSDRLAELVPQVDAVVLTLPLTDATEGLVDAEVVGAMKEGATFVNVGRGPVVDEEALIERLRDGSLAGAALDVFATEPLPTDSPLWELPNVLLTPHVMALVSAESERIVELFCDNARRLLDGEPLVNRVEPGVFY